MRHYEMMIILDPQLDERTVSPSLNQFLTVVKTQGGNVENRDTCHFTRAEDQRNTNPLLGPLAANGGFVMTQALQAGSPAIDAGLNSVCPAYDARGVVRPVDGDGNGSAICDAGAFEKQ